MWPGVVALQFVGQIMLTPTQAPGIVQLVLLMKIWLKYVPFVGLYIVYFIPLFLFVNVGTSVGYEIKRVT